MLPTDDARTRIARSSGVPPQVRPTALRATTPRMRPLATSRRLTASTAAAWISTVRSRSITPRTALFRKLVQTAPKSTLAVSRWSTPRRRRRSPIHCSASRTARPIRSSYWTTWDSPRSIRLFDDVITTAHRILRSNHYYGLLGLTALFRRSNENSCSKRFVQIGNADKWKRTAWLIFCKHVCMYVHRF